MIDNAAHPSSADRWELWNLRALQPGATLASLADLRRRREAAARRSEEVLVDGADAPGLITEARAFFRAHPEIRSGLVLSLHLGPYSLLPALYLLEGLEPTLVVDATSHERLRLDVEQRQARLGLPGRIQWITTDRPVFAGRMLKALRAGRPVMVYLDGNGGGGGMEATRDRGMPYRLPGRTIRVRTGLGRLIQRTECPVHGVAVSWRPDGGLAWTARRVGAWGVGASARQITRQIHDWLFDEVARAPEQWSFWSMLARAGDAFSADGLEQGPSPDDHARLWSAFRAASDAAPATTRLTLACDAQVWEPGILADPDHDRFWNAEGLCDCDLDLFRRGAEPTLEETVEVRGPEWLEFHGLRLVLLGVLELRTPSS